MLRSFRVSLVLVAVLACFADNAFSAQLFSGAQVWFRADAGVLNPLNAAAGNGDAVATWEDQIGTLDVSQSNASFRPTYVTNAMNGLPALEYDLGANDRLFNTTNLPTGARTVLFAGDANDSGPGGTLFAYRRATGGTLIHSNQLSSLSGTFFVYSDGVNGANNTTGPAGTLTTIRSPFVSAHKSVPGSKIGVDVNGSALALSQPGSVTAETSATSGFTVGGREDISGGNWQGLIGEVIVYDSILNSAQLTISSNYLASKWNTPLSVATDKYQGDTVGNGHYDFNVFGIGRAGADTNGSLAGTVSTGTWGNGLILSELNSSLDQDGKFLMAGDLNSSNTLTTANVPAGIEERFSRVWYVDNNGLTEATLTFDFSDAGIALPTGETFKLLYADSQALNFSVLDVLGNTSGDQVSFNLNASQLVDGYYTLALAPPVPEPSTLLLLAVGSLCIARRKRNRTSNKPRG